MDSQFIYDYLNEPSINISSVTGDDAGEYWCTGSNTHGDVMSPVANVRVLCKYYIELAKVITFMRFGTSIVQA